jgi:predicted Ser/Thr protein kinase
MGVVYLARDPIIDREVALKTLRVDLDSDFADEFRERFMREARAAGRLSHPGIVTIHDVGEDPTTGLVFIAMEFARGRDLKQVLQSGHRFRPAEAARVVAEIAMALDYAHSMGVVHRDVKPANIILTDSGRIRIMDFGVARLESSNLTTEGQFIGTPNYMSPEQVTGRPVDGRSDLFSLGVVLFELLAGERPFAGESIHEVTLKVVQAPTPIPSAVAPGVPAGFNPIVLKCLEKEPDKRFQRGAELARVLGALARALVGRDPADIGRTEVHQADLATRPGAGDGEPGAPAPQAVPDTGGPSAGTPVPPMTGTVPTTPLRQRLIDRLPEPLGRQVETRWVVRILAVWAVLWLAVAGVLVAVRDDGPFPAPSSGSARNLHLTFEALVRGERQLQAGDVQGAQASAAAALDQAPASPAVRRLAAATRAAAAAERSSAEVGERIASLISEGRQLYRQGRYSAAGERFRAVLELEPDNEIATSYLELATERGRVRNAPAATVPKRTQLVVVPSAMPTPRPTPGVARITVYFSSPINAGNLLVTLDGETLGLIPFDFTRSGFLGLKRRGSGQVRRILLAPSGEHAIGVRLTDAERGAIGSQLFHVDLTAGSDWTLRADLPEGAAAASFYLVKASGR